MPKRKPAPPAPARIIDGPTPETMRHGEYTLPETRGAFAVYTNRRQNPLGQLLGMGTISRKQAAGGLRFSETYEAVWGHGNARDSTIPRVGGEVHETDDQAARMAQGRARLHTILNRIGPRAYSMLVSVAVFGESLGENRGRNAERYDVFKAALDQCAIAYGVEGDEWAI